MLVLGLMAAAPRSHADQAYQCLLGKQTVDDPAGYKSRGDRCEGIYARPVSGDGLSLLGFEIRGAGFDPAKDRSVKLRVRAQPVGQPVVIEVAAAVPRVNYLMDTAGIRDGIFDWRLDVFRTTGLAASDVAAIACTNRCADRLSTAYLPVEFGTPGDPRVAAGPATMFFRSTVELTKVSVKVLRKGSPPPAGKEFPALSAPIVVPVGKLLASGDNDVEVVGFSAYSTETVSWRGHLLLPPR